MGNGVFEKAKFRIAGDRGLLIEYGETIDPAVNQKVRSMAMVVGKNMPDGVKEIIPTYRSILLLYDPAMTTPALLQETLTEMEERLSGIEIPPPKKAMI